MNSFHDLVVARRSVRKFTSQPIPAEDVKTIVEAGLMAPSSKRTMPWEFVLIDNKEILQQISECREMGTLPIKNCSLAILVCVDPEKSHAWLEDGSIAAVMMQLQAQDLGLGSCWVQIHGRYTADEESSQEFIRGIVSIPAGLEIVCVVAIGYPDEQKKPHDVASLPWEKVHIPE